MNLKKERPTTQSHIMECEQLNWHVHLPSAGPFFSLALNDLLTHLTIPKGLLALQVTYDVVTILRSILGTGKSQGKKPNIAILFVNLPACLY